MTDSWALKAIETAAMARAEQRLRAMPQVFYWMGVSGERLTWLILEYERRTGKRAATIDVGEPAAVDPGGCAPAVYVGDGK